MADERLRPDEAEQYDRQIRLWGLEAQKRSVDSYFVSCVNKDCIAGYERRES